MHLFLPSNFIFTDVPLKRFMMQQDNINEAAAQLRNAQQNYLPCSPIRELIGESDIETAYAIQKVNVDFRLQNGATRVGAKIGLTSLAVQKQLGVDQPDFGILFADTQVQNGGEISIKEILQPKAEAEIAFVLKSDLPNSNYTESDILNATEYVCGAIEIVGSRVENWNIRITDTVADNASASHFVLGDEKYNPTDVDMVGCKMSLMKNNEVVSEGSGAACMGSPVAAVVWLANTMSNLGTPLQSGDIILSGALGPMSAAVACDHFVAHIEGFGNVSFKMTE